MGYKIIVKRAFFPLLFMIMCFCTALLSQSLYASENDANEVNGGQARPNEAHILFAARSIGNTSRTRLIMDFDRPVTYKSRLLDDPKRIVLQFPKVFFKLPNSKSALEQGIIRTFRYGAIDQKSSRIILNLQTPALIINEQMQELKDDKRFRVILDIESVDEELYQSKLQAQSTISSEPKEVVKNGVSAQFNEFSKEGRENILIILDPGHGGIDSGAKGKNLGNQVVVEKNITLSFAKILKSKLDDIQGIEVLLTRKSDEFITLSKRVAFAQANQADLFISIHADSLREHYIRGASIYTLSKKASDQLSERLAQSENMVDEVAGERPPNIAAVNDILSDLTTRETGIFSHSFARIVLTQFKGKINLIKNPLRSAGFHVLKAPGVPSILLELGYLSNHEDEKLLINSKWQSKVADYLVKSIQQHIRQAKPLP